ncbi:MAG TPA: MOSC domain-containing protein [Ktedonobacteraceae bacterium]|jgi:MOSC domain-containing protein YiiM|nr:MOSC domain-containing protein [Ktedonobacteraceae bacterium]
MMQAGVLQSVQVGTPQQYDIESKTKGSQRSWETSFFRTPSEQPRWLYTTHLEGNTQADTKHHGTLSQAVLLYAAAHYPLWQAELGRPEMGPGGFGENFTVGELSEETACIGDIYAIGEAHIQVTGPRYPCQKIQRRWNIRGLTARVAKTGRTGWYCRVVREGMIEPDTSITLVERPYPQWTIALTNDFGHSRNKDVETAKALAACPLLEGFWRELVVRSAMSDKEV